MKQGSSIKNFIVLIVTAAVILFIYVASVTEIKRMNKEKIIKKDLLNEKMNRLEAKIVDFQKLTSEERIVKYAQDSLGLIRPTENLDSIIISKDQADQIEKMLKEKYDY
jgi:hypothetical protein